MNNTKFLVIKYNTLDFIVKCSVILPSKLTRKVMIWRANALIDLIIDMINHQDREFDA